MNSYSGCGGGAFHHNGSGHCTTATIKYAGYLNASSSYTSNTMGKIELGAERSGSKEKWLYGVCLEGYVGAWINGSWECAEMWIDYYELGNSKATTAYNYINLNFFRVDTKTI